MNNVESMDYTHSHPSTIASLSKYHTPFAGIIHPPYTFLKTATITTYHGISIAILRYIAMQLSTVVGTPILSHIDPACNTSYHLAASRTVLPRVPPYLARDRLRLLAHVYDSVASIHMTENPGRHG